MIFRIIDKTTKMFLRDSESFKSETEQAIQSTHAPKFGKDSRYVGQDENNQPIWEDTRTQEQLDAIALIREKAIEKQKNIAYMSATNYVGINYGESDDKESFKAELSSRFGVLNSVILATRKSIHATLNEGEKDD